MSTGNKSIFDHTWDDTKRRATYEVDDVMKGLRARVLNAVLRDKRALYKDQEARNVAQRIPTTPDEVKRAVLDALMDNTLPAMGNDQPVLEAGE